MTNPNYYQQQAEQKAEERRRKAAWKQQQRASKEYAKEARRNGYPGQQPAGGWQNLHPVYRKGPNVAAIVWGGITLIAGAVAGIWMLMPYLFVSSNVWAIVLAIGFAAIGLSLVIGAIITSVSGIRKKKSSDAPESEPTESEEEK